MKPSDPLFPILCPNEGSLIQFASDFARTLDAGSVIALNGPLGAGKTHFSKGLAQGLGYTGTVTSPTFSLVQEYRGEHLPIFHFDFYRIENEDELIRLGWDDYLDEGGLVIAEWAERFPSLLPPATHWLSIEPQSDQSRLIHLRRT